MYNELDHQVNRARLNDMQREAEKQHKANRLLKRLKRDRK